MKISIFQLEDSSVNFAVCQLNLKTGIDLIMMALRKLNKGIFNWQQLSDYKSQLTDQDALCTTFLYETGLYCKKPIFKFSSTHVPNAKETAQ